MKSEWKCIKITSIFKQLLYYQICICTTYPSLSVSVQILWRETLRSSLHPCPPSLRLRSKELIFSTLATSVSGHLPVPWTEGSPHCLEETAQLSTVLPHAWQEDLRRAWQLLPGQEQVSAVSWRHISLRRDRKPRALFFVSFTFFFCLLE